MQINAVFLPLILIFISKFLVVKNSNMKLLLSPILFVLGNAVQQFPKVLSQFRVSLESRFQVEAHNDDATLFARNGNGETAFVSRFAAHLKIPSCGILPTIQREGNDGIDI